MAQTGPDEVLRDVEIWRGALDTAAQTRAVEALREVARAAPFVRPMTRRGPMSVRMTSAGQVGWVAGPSGYDYAAQHPSGAPWPPIPSIFLDLWARVVPKARPPECCLVNFYGEGARMGLHQDRDEADFSQPVVSLSLGDDALFRIGNQTRGGTTQSTWLNSGDVAVLGGPARLRFHGVDRIRFGSSALLPEGGRINVTLRVVT